MIRFENYIDYEAILRLATATMIAKRVVEIQKKFFPDTYYWQTKTFTNGPHFENLISLNYHLFVIV